MMAPGFPTSLVAMLIALAGVRLAGGDEEDIRHTITSLSTHGSRLAGYPGDRHAADLVERRLAGAGVTRLSREPYEVVVPIDYGAAMEVLEPEAATLLGDEPIPLQSLWPNLVRTNTLGPDGITGDLFYGGAGRYQDFNGHEVAGNVVLMKYNSWKNWKNAAALGAAAIIFIEPQETTRQESRHKWSWAPVHVPRFWLDAETGRLLRNHLRASGSVRVRLDARMDWESRTTWNIWGIVPGADPELADEVIAVQSYYDGISVVPANNPAAESATAIAALLELADFLAEHPPGRTVALLATGSHFLESSGLFEWFDRHARKLQPFRNRMPKRFVADALDVERLTRETARIDLTPDSLGITLTKGGSGDLKLDTVDLEKLTAELKLRQLEPDSLGIKLEPDSLAISLFVALDLASHSDQIGVVQSAGMPAHRRFFLPLGRSFRRHGEEAAAQLGREPSALVNLVSPVKGLSWDSYLDYDSFRDAGGIAVDVGLMDLNIITTADARLVLDSPLDTPDRVDFTNVQRQSDMINQVLLKASWDAQLFGENAAELRRIHDKNIIDARLAVDGRLRLLPRRSPTPDDPVPHGMVVIINHRFSKLWRPLVHLADAEGNYRARGLNKGEAEIWGFLVDGRVEDWRAGIRVRWVSLSFRHGPQSGSHRYVYSPREGGENGRRQVNVVPLPTSLCTSIMPPWSSMIL